MRKFRTRTLILGLTLGIVALALITMVAVLRQVLLVDAAALTDSSLQTEGERLSSFFETQQLAPDQSVEQFANDTLQQYVDANTQVVEETLVVMQGTRVLAQRGPQLANLGQLVTNPANTPEVYDGLFDRQTDQGQLRVLAKRVDPPITNGLLLVAVSTEGRQDFVFRAFRDVAIVAAGTLLIACFLAWFVAGRVVRPIESLAQTAQDVTVQDLSERLPSQGTTEVAHLIDSFNAMVDRLESLVTEQRQFLNDASHELRTPLTIMRGHLEMASQNHEKTSDATSIAMSELDRMGRIVDDLLVLARARQVDFLRIAPVDSDDFLSSVVDRVSVMDDRNWVIDATPLGVVYADVQRLDQVMLNLCLNAHRHSAPGSEIGVGAELGLDKFRMWVRDVGEGIAPNDQERIFERFQRGATQRSSGGSAGLGLSIVRAIANAHGGTVTVKSEPGLGSCFTVVIPTEPPMQKA